MDKLHLEYLGRYLLLCEETLEKITKASTDKLKELCAKGEYVQPVVATGDIVDGRLSFFKHKALKNLNKEYTAKGLDANKLRTSIVAEDAVIGRGAWYTSACY